MSEINEDFERRIQLLPGPVAVFGAGGFIGVNLLKFLLARRSDVIGVSQDHINNWRFIANEIPHKYLNSTDILQQNQIREFFRNHRPKTIFNLAAYGAYSKQNEYDKIYHTNFLAAVNLIEVAKEYGFEAFVQAGSSSEYGFNSKQPGEDDKLLPNSHYAVSKTAVYQAINYYGKVEKLNVSHLRLYSVTGPWEEPDRLIPVLVAHARRKQFPPLVNPDISRDFVFVDDVCRAFVLAASKAQSIKGEAFNIGTGVKTTIRQLAQKAKELFDIPGEPLFGSMPDRHWDTIDWYCKPDKANNVLGWKAQTGLEESLKIIARVQEETDFDNAYWNWTK